MPSPSNSLLRLLAIATLTAATVPLHAQHIVHVRSHEAFVQAVETAKPGTKILVEPGVYRGNTWLRNVQGVAEHWIGVVGADPDNPPVFRGGKGTLQFTDPAYLVIENIIIEGAEDNGLNIDDGADYSTPAHHVVIKNVRVRSIKTGGDRNNDAIKMSGVDHFVIENCVIEDWGGNQSSGIDMVGCHDGLITGCVFGKGDPAQLGVGIQTKCGSERITISRCLFNQAGERAVQMGGRGRWSNFRPRKQQPYEAMHVVVEDCTFIGGEAPVTFVGARDCTFHFNTVYMPRLHHARILMEDSEPGMKPTAYNTFSDNIVVFDGRARPRMNVGRGTDAATFTFARNWWFRSDRPEASRVELPAAETDAVHGQDPMLTNPEAGDLTLKAGSLASAFGAGARDRSKQSPATQPAATQP